MITDLEKVIAEFARDRRVGLPRAKKIVACTVLDQKIDWKSVRRELHRAKMEMRRAMGLSK